jgi:plasmid stabilization system protein ParE
MSFKVQYSADARQDLRNIFNYIAKERTHDALAYSWGVVFIEKMRD